VDAEKTANAVKSALQLGYRHIDTAKFYNNEEAVGKGVRDSLVPRESIWVTTKVWHDQLRRDDVVKSLIDSHKKLNIGTIDLALIHWPSPDSVVPIGESIAGFQDAQSQQLIRHFGVSNFTAPLLEEALNACAQFTWEHMGREEGVVLPAARRYLRDADWNTLSEAFAALAAGKLPRTPTL